MFPIKLSIVMGVRYFTLSYLKIIDQMFIVQE